MTTSWQPEREPLRRTLVRTVTIALVAGAVLAWWWPSLGWRGLPWGGFVRWPIATLLALWPSLGGHWVELWFLNRLRPRLPSTRAIQVGARLVVWFVGGIGLTLAMGLTARALVGLRLVRWPSWRLGGLGFIGIELVAHLVLQLRGRNSFYNGRG